MENIIKLFNNAVGWSILHSLWQAATVYFILSGLFLFFHKMTADTKYKIAYAAQILVFASFVYTFIHYFQYPILYNTNNGISESDQFILYLTSLHNRSWSITQLFPYIVVIYSLGIILQIILCSKSIQLLHRIKKSSSSLLPLEWSNSFEKIKNQYNVPSKTTLLASENITDPITIGFIKPLIIFPTAYFNKISVEDAEAILLHEIAHIKRHDYFFNLILITIETLLFFNPFVWLISKYIKLERELSCDDFVTKAVISPISYARTLLQIELLRHELTPKMAMALSGNNKNNLLNRIKRINNQIMETKKTYFKHQLMAILFTSVTFIFIAWINPSDIKKTINQELAVQTAIKKIEEIPTAQDTTKNGKRTVKKKVIIKTDTSEVILNDNKEIEAYLNASPDQKKQLEEIEVYFDSPAWKEKVAAIETNAKQVEEYFNSAAWKDKIALIEENAKKVEEHINSAEYKNTIQSIEENAKKIEEFYNSPDYKKKIQSIQETNKKIEALYNSPAYKKAIQSVEENARKVEAIYKSPEYKKRIQTIEDNARELRALYNSPEYKKKMESLEESTRMIESEYNVPGWKEKITK